MKKILILFLYILYLTGCTKSKEITYDEYETLKYAEKVYELIEKYQIADISAKELTEKLDVLYSSIKASEEDDIEHYLDKCKSKNDTENSKEIKKRTFELFISSTTININSLNLEITHNNSEEINNIKEEIENDLIEIKEKIKNCN